MLRQAVLGSAGQCWAGRRWSRYSPVTRVKGHSQHQRSVHLQIWRKMLEMDQWNLIVIITLSPSFSLIHLVSVSHENHQDFSRFQSECFTSFKSQKIRSDLSEILVVFPSARPHMVPGCQAWPGLVLVCKFSNIMDNTGVRWSDRYLFYKQIVQRSVMKSSRLFW